MRPFLPLKTPKAVRPAPQATMTVRAETTGEEFCAARAEDLFAGLWAKVTLFFA
jgi:hypothetical protein